MEKLKAFLGTGYGYGSGSGSGSGYGSGYGSSYGYGYGSGDGSGSGSGSSYGSGSGSSYGSGSGYGYGSGSGDGSGIKSINGQKIHKIDNVFTIIDNLKGNIAKGKIVNPDLTMDKCYVVKQGNMFAHGKTLRQAREAIISKILLDKPVEERVTEFKKAFKKGVKYKAKLFYDWHYRLTGSCEYGRDNFVKNKSIDLNKDMFTIQEFVKLVDSSYGGNIVKQVL